MPYLEPVPESAMRYVRPLGIGLLALFLALPLAIPVDLLFGPFGRDRMQYVIPAIAVVLFWPLMRLSRYRREREARRALVADAPPAKGASLLLAGLIAVALGTFGLVAVLRGAAFDGRELEAFLVFLAAGSGAVAVGIRRIKARSTWRAQRRGR